MHLASLIEELIQTLTQEEEIYNELIPIAKEKTQIIIKNDLDKLQKITDIEQEAVDRLTALEHKRMDVLQNIGVVINRDPKLLTLKAVTEILKKQPKEQKQLSVINDRLKQTIQILVEINNHNKSLINESLEIIEFNMNFIQSTRMSPGNNYTKGAKQMDMYLPTTGIFDAKQ